MSKSLKVLLAVLVAVFLLGACGDDDDTGDDASSEVDGAADDEETPSADDDGDAPDEGAADSEFVQQADAFCAETNQKAGTAISQYVEEHPEVQQAEEFSDLPEDAQSDISELFSGAFGDLVDDLRSLAPEGQEDEWTNVLDDFDDAVDEFEDDPEAAFAGDSLTEVTAQLAEFGVECGG